jgi:lipoprotein-releasing system permease protein
MGYELMVGLRYLRARRKEAFISLITVISVVGVMIGVMTLNIVLAVMTGFEEDLRDRILGFNPHIVVVSYAGAIRDADKVLATVRDTPGVVAAAPLVYSQVMLTTGQSVSGVVVRGVPPGDDAAIVDLKGHLSSGSIDRLGAEFEVPPSGDSKTPTKLTGVIIGQELAKQLGVDVGDPVSVVSPMGRRRRSV